MKPKTVITLIVVLALCTLYVLVRFLPTLDGGDEKGQPDRRVFAAKVEDIRKVTIVADSGDRMVFRKDGDDWFLDEPVRSRAESWKVTDVRDLFSDLKYAKAYSPGDTNAPGNDLTRLDSPSWTVTAVDGAGTEHTLEVGALAPPPPDGRTYVKRPGDDRVFVIDKDLHDTLAKGVSEYRSTTVVDVKKDEVVRLLVTGRVRFELKRSDDGWGIVSPVSARADDSEVSSLLGKFNYLSAKEFVDDAPASLAPFGLDQPRLTLQWWVQPKDDEPAPEATTTPEATTKPAPEPLKHYVLELGNVARKMVYAKFRGESSVFTLDESLLDDLQPTAASLRSKQILDVKTDDVDRVVLALPSGKAEMRKVDGAWRMISPFAGPASSAAVATYVASVGELKAQEWATDAMTKPIAGLDKPRATITLYLAGQGKTISLLLGATSASGEVTFVKSADGTEIAAVKTTEAAKVMPNPAKFWPTKLLALPFGEKITRVDLTRAGEVLTAQRGDDHVWKLTAPLAAKADPAAMDKIVLAMQDVSATEIVSLGTSVPDTYAKAASLITVKLTTETPAPAPTTQPTSAPAPKPIVKTHTLGVAKIDGETYAFLAGATPAVVGKMAAELHETLAAELRDTKVLSVAGEDVSALTITTDGEACELRREGDGWKYAADRFVKISTSKVDGVLDVLKDLSAERFALHTAPPDPKAFGLVKPRATIELQRTQGDPIRLVIGDAGPTGGIDRYATCTTAGGVFVLTSETVDKLTKTLADLKD